MIAADPNYGTDYCFMVREQRERDEKSKILVFFSGVLYAILVFGLSLLSHIHTNTQLLSVVGSRDEAGTTRSPASLHINNTSSSNSTNNYHNNNNNGSQAEGASTTDTTTKIVFKSPEIAGFLVDYCLADESAEFSDCGDAVAQPYCTR